MLLARGYVFKLCATICLCHFLLVLLSLVRLDLFYFFFTTWFNVFLNLEGQQTCLMGRVCFVPIHLCIKHTMYVSVTAPFTF